MLGKAGNWTVGLGGKAGSEEATGAGPEDAAGADVFAAADRAANEAGRTGAGLAPVPDPVHDLQSDGGGY
jgi:hypothetical protein